MIRLDRSVILRVLLLLLSGLLLWTLWGMVNGWLAQSWPTTEGVVYSSMARGSGSGHKAGSTLASVLYRYSVDGKVYYGDHIYYTDHSPGKRRALELSRRFPSGATVQVYYRPERPARSLLIPGASPEMYKMLGYTLLFIVPIALILRARRPSGLY